MFIENALCSIEDIIKRHRLEEIVSKFNFEDNFKVYIGSGSMFSRFDRLGLELISDLCEQCNLDYYLPQHNDSINDKTGLVTNRMIVKADDTELQNCDVLLAHFTLPEDSGLSCEVGFANGLRIPVYGIFDDIRIDGLPTTEQIAEENQHAYINSYTAGKVKWFDTLYDLFEAIHMYYIYKKK